MPADGFNQNWIDTLCMESQHAWHLLRKIDKFNCFPPRLWKPTIMQIRGPSIFWRQEKIDVWEKCGRKPFQTTEKEEQRRKLTPSVMTASFKNWSMFTEKLALLKYCLCSNWWERVAHSPCAKKYEFLVNLDRFSKFLKYFKYFEKWSKLTKNSDFFVHGEHATLSHHLEPS
jgi:hypothetical protein